MASPQIENGYTRIANEVLEAVAKAGLNGLQTAVLLTIFRLSYGMNGKKDAELSYMELAKRTGRSKPACWRAVKFLISAGILSVEKSGSETIFKFEKDHEKWVKNTRPVTHRVTRNPQGYVTHRVTEPLPTGLRQRNPQGNATFKEKRKKETPIVPKPKVGKKYPPKKYGVFKPDFLSDQDWNDLLKHRKEKKASSGDRALKILKEQLETANKQGWKSKELVDEIITRGWRGFKAEWLKNNPKKPTRGKLVF